MSYLRKSVSGEEDKSVTLAAGTAEIGKLAAGTAEIGKLAAGTAAIGSVTVSNSPTVNQQPATWYVNDSDTGGTNSVATKAAGGAGTNHYICGIVASHLTIDDYNGETATAELKTGSTTILKSGIMGAASKGYYQGGDALYISFPHPIKAGSNEAVTLTVDPENSGGTTFANIWGYTV